MRARTSATSLAERDFTWHDLRAQSSSSGTQTLFGELGVSPFPSLQSDTLMPLSCGSRRKRLWREMGRCEDLCRADGI